MGIHLFQIEFTVLGARFLLAHFQWSDWRWKAKLQFQICRALEISLLEGISCTPKISKDPTSLTLGSDMF